MRWFVGSPEMTAEAGLSLTKERLSARFGAASSTPLRRAGKPFRHCGQIDSPSDKPRPAKPEEIVRQLYLKLLIDDYAYGGGFTEEIKAMTYVTPDRGDFDIPTRYLAWGRSCEEMIGISHILGQTILRQFPV